MTDNEIIQEATEAVEKGLPCAFLVPPLLEVVKSQKEEINILIRKKEALQDEIAEKDAEIENLKNTQKETALSLDKILKEVREAKVLYVRDIAKAKSEAYREFAERFKQKYDKPLFYLGSYEQFMCEVDNLVKELTESNE